MLAFNILLSVAFIACYRSMFALRSKPWSRECAERRYWTGRRDLRRVDAREWCQPFLLLVLVDARRQEPLSMELMGALVHSHLLDVCMLIELVTGALILLGYFVPAALCVAMAVSTCALYWAILDHQPLTLTLGVVAFSLNGLLMLAYLRYYKGAFQRAPLTLGESGSPHAPGTLCSCIPTAALRAAISWPRCSRSRLSSCRYTYSGPDLYAPWDLLVLLYPAVVLHVRRLHDIGSPGWLVLVPAA